MNREGTGTKREQEKAEYTEESCRSKENREIKKRERGNQERQERHDITCFRIFPDSSLCEWTVL